MEERKKGKMKINAIGVTTFGNKQQVIKKAAAGFMAAAGAGLAADTFVKGISKPDKSVDNELLIGNDEGWNPVDPCCDAALGTPKEQREDSGCDC